MTRKPAIRTPAVDVPQAASAPEAGMEGVVADPQQAEGMMTALLATGESPINALVAVATAFGPEAAKSQCGVHLDRIIQAVSVDLQDFTLLDKIAQVLPDLARAWLPFHIKAMCGEQQYANRVFDFSDTPWITHLPVTPASKLDASNCDSLVSLPDGLEFGSLELCDCRSLQTLPARLKVLRLLDLKNCTALRSLPDDLSMAEDASLFLGGCTSLERLTDHLKVGGLNLQECRALKELPEGLCVKKNVDLRGCVSWDGVIPEDARIGGLILMDRYPQGVSLVQFRMAEAARKCLDGIL